MLELQLADLKLKQQEEKSAKEETQMQLYAEQVSQLMATEKSLRLQLAADEERFQQFQVYEYKYQILFKLFQINNNRLGINYLLVFNFKV